MEARHGSPIGEVSPGAVKAALGALRERGASRKGWISTEAGALPGYLAGRALALGAPRWTLTDRCLVVSWPPAGSSRDARVAFALTPYAPAGSESVALAVATMPQEAPAASDARVSVVRPRKARAVKLAPVAANVAPAAAEHDAEWFEIWGRAS